MFNPLKKIVFHETTEDQSEPVLNNPERRNDIGSNIQSLEKKGNQNKALISILVFNPLLSHSVPDETELMQSTAKEAAGNKRSLLNSCGTTTGTLCSTAVTSVPFTTGSSGIRTTSDAATETQTASTTISTPSETAAGAQSSQTASSANVATEKTSLVALFAVCCFMLSVF